MKKIGLIVAVACLFIITGLVHQPAYAIMAKPTGTKATSNLPDRLFKAKTVAKKHVLKRENEIKRLKQLLNRKSASMMKADVATLETEIATMENKLKTWRSEIDKATTIDQLKELHKKWFMETRVFAVFAPKISQMVRLSILEKNDGRAKNRVSTQETTISKKRKNEKNQKLEIATKKHEEAKLRITEVQTKLAELKAKVSGYTAADFNANQSEFRTKVKATSSEIAQSSKKLVNAMKTLKEVGELLKTIANEKASPTP